MVQSRRSFLKSALGASTIVSFSPAIPAFLRQAAAASTASNRDTVLVVLQLTGGNDGLNTVVPFENDAYGRSRRTLRLTRHDVHRIDDSLGFHPEMKACHRLFQDGLFSIVQGVGYANSDRAHDVAMRDWQTAKPGEATCQTGWIGRAIDQVAGPESTDAPGIFVGPIQKPFALNAEHSIVPAIREADGLLLKQPLAVPANASTSPNPLLTLVGKGSVEASRNSERLKEVLDNPSSQGDYPPISLAHDLQTISQLIQADIGLRIVFAELGGGGFGGFDNHANQKENHAALLAQLSESVGAFIRDLDRTRQLDRVLLMTFSEFGRTVSENGRRGTGHGAAQPVMLAGGRLKGGLYGVHPNLEDLVEDAPRAEIDFRRLYATVLDDWLGFESQPVLGQTYKTLPVLSV